MILVKSPYSTYIKSHPCRSNPNNGMAATYYDPSPEVAAAMKASATRSVNTMAGILALIGLCWLLLAAFFIYNFSRPLKSLNPENATRHRVVVGGTEKRWWIDNDDAV
ncbi:uncharacterized protein F4812DRAFT_411798 [Daldinia caldariorum]|uniref:uncharacterized protein n=1 Tax=Daldinia caldariorum TaxID=326644 RepID=UPI0020089FD4|nr:uncharacterized protein F4812DRAFT_411798 [Daldinia caldariorum]KAI1473158.1 hypothetical protein F4812DRAFT_411798 [Daldinia caldariorum]